MDASAASKTQSAISPGCRRSRPQGLSPPANGDCRLRMGPGQLSRGLLGGRTPAGTEGIQQLINRYRESRWTLRCGDGARLSDLETVSEVKIVCRRAASVRQRGLRTGPEAGRRATGQLLRRAVSLRRNNMG